jgi:hypothetical protein
MIRYSIRYMPGDAPINSAMEPGLQQHPELLDRPMREAGAWYPRAYPSAIGEELEQLPHLMDGLLASQAKE